MKEKESSKKSESSSSSSERIQVVLERFQLQRRFFFFFSLALRSPRTPPPRARPRPPTETSVRSARRSSPRSSLTTARPGAGGVDSTPSRSRRFSSPSSGCRRPRSASPRTAYPYYTGSLGRLGHDRAGRVDERLLSRVAVAAGSCHRAGILGGGGRGLAGGDRRPGHEHGHPGPRLHDLRLVRQRVRADPRRRVQAGGAHRGRVAGHALQPRCGCDPLLGFGELQAVHRDRRQPHGSRVAAVGGHARRAEGPIPSSLSPMR